MTVSVKRITSRLITMFVVLLSVSRYPAYHPTGESVRKTSMRECIDGNIAHGWAVAAPRRVATVYILITQAHVARLWQIWIIVFTSEKTKPRLGERNAWTIILIAISAGAGLHPARPPTHPHPPRPPSSNRNRCLDYFIITWQWPNLIFEQRCIYKHRFNFPAI